MSITFAFGFPMTRPAGRISRHAATGCGCRRGVATGVVPMNSRCTRTAATATAAAVMMVACTRSHVMRNARFLASRWICLGPFCRKMRVPNPPVRCRSPLVTIAPLQGPDRWACVASSIRRGLQRPGGSRRPRWPGNHPTTRQTDIPKLPRYRSECPVERRQDYRRGPALRTGQAAVLGPGRTAILGRKPRLGSRYVALRSPAKAAPAKQHPSPTPKVHPETLSLSPSYRHLP